MKRRRGFHGGVVADSLHLESQDVSTLRAAVLQTLAYADVFDYPLTAGEVHRYLVGVRAPLSAVREMLDDDGLVRGRLCCRSGFYALPGRESIVETRLRRADVAARAWPRACRYGYVIARLPFVRMVAVTGALAVDNVELGADIDYLVVTESGRLWLCRALVVALVRLAARRGVEVCPNYFLSEHALTLEERSLFTAHELMQMAPISGLATYLRMRQVNVWAGHFLPNAYYHPPTGLRCQAYRQGCEEASCRSFCSPMSFTEAVLMTRAGAWLERWEMERKLRKFGQQSETGQARPAAACPSQHPEATFSADRCKGHFAENGQRIFKAFMERLRSLDLPLPGAVERAAELSGELRGGGA